MDFESARRQMIAQQLRTWDVLDDRVLSVMAHLPRELFVPPEWRALAYADTDIPLGHGRQLAPPKIQGRALQALLPQPDETALEIGSGTGYLTACLAMLAARVTGVELQAGLAARARENLATLAIGNVELREGDGLSMAFPDPFDVICVNGSLPEWNDRIRQLLAPGGRLFAVVGQPPIMTAHRVTRVCESEWRTDKLFETCLPPLENAHPTPEFVF